MSRGRLAAAALAAAFACGYAPASAAAAAAPAAQTERVWLVVGASDGSPARIARAAQRLAPQMPKALVVQMRDCGEAKTLYAVAEPMANYDAARAAREKLRAAAPDAYLKLCPVQPGSLLAMRVSAVDASIADVPATAVNWSDADRVTSLLALSQGRRLLITRHYAADASDPLEGRRERVSLVQPTGVRTPLEEQCASAGRLAARGERFAFECAREEAGEQLLHSVLAFDAAGRRLAAVDHCRRPVWESDRLLRCEAESVDARGRLVLRAKRVEVGAGR